MHQNKSKAKGEKLPTNTIDCPSCHPINGFVSSSNLQGHEDNLGTKIILVRMFKSIECFSPIQLINFLIHQLIIDYYQP